MTHSWIDLDDVNHRVFLTDNGILDWSWDADEGALASEILRLASELAAVKKERDEAEEAIRGAVNEASKAAVMTEPHQHRSFILFLIGGSWRGLPAVARAMGRAK